MTMFNRQAFGALLLFFAGLVFFGTRAAVYSEESAPSVTAVELAEKTEAFWNGIKSLDVKYEVEIPVLMNDNDEFLIVKESPRWLYDRATNRQRLTTPKETKNGDTKFDNYYFDGDSTFHFCERDPETPTESLLNLYMGSNAQAVVCYGWNMIPCKSDNFPYAPWFSDGLGDEKSMKSLGFQFGDRELSFSEWVAKYPASAPARSVDEEGDVLWTFRVWNNPQTAQLFPVGTDETKAEDGSVGKEEAAQAIFYDVVINESKNYLLHAYRTAAFFPEPDGENVTAIREYKTLEYLSESGLFFPKKTEVVQTFGGKSMPPQRHDVEELRANRTDLDLDSFNIPELTFVSIRDTRNHKHKIKKEEIAVWGKDGAPAEVYSLKEFRANRYSIKADVYKKRLARNGQTLPDEDSAQNE